MIFGFLTKFRILKNLFREKIIFLEMKNIFRKSAEFFFRDQQMFETLFDEKVNEKSKFQNFEKFPEKIEILKF